MNIPCFLTFDERPKVRDFAKLVLAYISQHPGVPRTSINLEFKTSSNIATNELLSCIIRNLLLHLKIVRKTTDQAVLFWVNGAPGSPVGDDPQLSSFLIAQAEADYQKLLPKRKAKELEPSVERQPKPAQVEQKESPKEDSAPAENDTRSLEEEGKAVLAGSLTGLYKKVFDVISDNPPTTVWTSETLRNFFTYPQPRVNTLGATLGRLWSFGLLRKFVNPAGSLYYRLAGGRIGIAEDFREVPYVGPASKSVKGQARSTRKLLAEQARQQDLDSQLDDVILDKTKFHTLTATGDSVTAAVNWPQSPIAAINSNNILSLVRDDGTSITFSETETLAIKSLFR